jgi:hypothetical protein
MLTMETMEANPNLDHRSLPMAVQVVELVKAAINMGQAVVLQQELLMEVLVLLHLQHPVEAVVQVEVVQEAQVRVEMPVVLQQVWVVQAVVVQAVQEEQQAEMEMMRPDLVGVAVVVAVQAVQTEEVEMV